MLVAIGPTAHEALAIGHPDLALIDEVRPAAAVCMFDVRDEAWWQCATRRVRKLPKPRWFVISADLCRHRPLMRRLAFDLDACIVATRPGDLLHAALLPLSGLVRPGVIGMELSDLVAACAAPSIAFASFNLDERNQADSVLLVIRDPRNSIADINALCERVLASYPDADMLVAAPMLDVAADVELLAPGLLAIERTSR